MFKGRSNRATYWFSLAVLAAIYSLLILIGARTPHVGEVILAFIAIPRLHDIGKSGWWFGGAVIAEIVLTLLVLVTLSTDTAETALGALVFVFACPLIWLGAVRGDPYSNPYGEPPTGTLNWQRK
jgi:uncharacterized membrane protein YhaH (DUF805 family)